MPFSWTLMRLNLDKHACRLRICKHAAMDATYLGNDRSGCCEVSWLLEKWLGIGAPEIILLCRETKLGPHAGLLWANKGIAASWKSDGALTQIACYHFVQSSFFVCASVFNSARVRGTHILERANVERIGRDPRLFGETGSWVVILLQLTIWFG